MSSPVSRRSFLKRAAASSGFLLVSNAFGVHATSLLPYPPPDARPDIAAVTGDNAYDATVRAVELLGGISQFAPAGSRVGILVNSKFSKRGTYVKPQIALATVTMLYQAGVREIVSIDDVESSYWKRATLSKEHEEYVRAIRRPGSGISVALSGARHLKEVEMVREYLECDAIVNIAIFKDHEGTKMSGALKNIMGATAGSTNRYWHLGSGASGYYDDVTHLSRCIADGNLCRKPALCIGDATEVIVRNGPFGPGPTKDFRTVVAGTNPVSFDSFGAAILGFRPDDILMIRAASELGLGSSNLDALRIQRTNL
jgi:uncharacterized protein (DUF362 family)